MEEKNENTVDSLHKKINRLLQNQEQLKTEISSLKKEIDSFTTSGPSKTKLEPIDVAFPNIEPIYEKSKDELAVTSEFKTKFNQNSLNPSKAKEITEKNQWEEFIGTNLLNKIGIVILVVGLSYGVKYSIDHNLIIPITRIILGYLAGIILIAIAIKIKHAYKTFSAVLLSGAMASFYFITYAAYDLYHLMPQAMAFVLMVIFTAFTVFASIAYNEKVIAIIGLVGAYAVPFLLSDGTGRAAILFSYISIVNCGILFLAFRKEWKQLYYIAFAFTWLIFSVWFLSQYQAIDHLWMSLTFSTLFFAIFYIIFLSYKITKNESLNKWDIVLLVFNSFLYFGYGYSAIDAYHMGEQFLGIFTLFNAIMHFIMCYVIFRQQGSSRDTFYLVAGMVLVFLTLAVPVQLDGNWVTFTWAAEAILLFWIGRTKTLPVYERLSYILIFLAVGSLFEDWLYYGKYSVNSDSNLFIQPLLNKYFFTSIFVLTSLGGIIKLSMDKQFSEPVGKIQYLFDWGLIGIFLFLLFMSLFKEIDNYWIQRYTDSDVMIIQSADNRYTFYDNDLLDFKKLWLIIYAAIFGIVLTLVNRNRIKSSQLVIVLTVFNAIVLLVFVFDGLPSLANLRNSYINQTDSAYYFRDWGSIAIRYLALLFIIPVVYLNRIHIKQDIFNILVKRIEQVLFHAFVLILLSTETVHWLELTGVNQSFKLWLSILWGGYALFLIIIGLKRNDKPLRTMALILFGVTLLKLFFYDMSEMTTIAKTVVMIILGALLLVSSFLYNKVKKVSEVNDDIDKPESLKDLLE